MGYQIFHLGSALREHQDFDQWDKVSYHLRDLKVQILEEWHPWQVDLLVQSSHQEFLA